jgi:nucleoside-diphosphate-sugar epimerase
MTEKARVLVTGTTGFVGSHLVPKLVESGYDVYSLERYVTGRYVLGGRREVKTVFGDLRDGYAIKRIVREVRPSVVIHLAAISPVSYSYDHPQEVIETNLLGAVNLAEACLHEVDNFKQFLFSSTSETYGNGPNPKNEETLQNPNSPYAVSKVTTEKYLLYMLEAFNFPLTILRNFNTYGRKNNTHFIVERIITQMLTGKRVELGDPNPIRDLVYIDDHVNAYLSCLDNPNAIGQIFNFGTGVGIRIKDLTDKIANLTGFKGEVCWNTIPERPLDIQVLISDYSKAERVIGWKPEFTLENGLKKTIEFWKDKLNATA